MTTPLLLHELCILQTAIAPTLALDFTSLLRIFRAGMRDSGLLRSGAGYAMNTPRARHFLLRRGKRYCYGKMTVRGLLVQKRTLKAMNVGCECISMNGLLYFALSGDELVRHVTCDISFLP